MTKWPSHRVNYIRYIFEWLSHISIYNSCTLYILSLDWHGEVSLLYREIFKFGFEIAWISVVFKLLGNELKNSPAKLVNAVKVSKSELNSEREMSQFFFCMRKNKILSISYCISNILFCSRRPCIKIANMTRQPTAQNWN